MAETFTREVKRRKRAVSLAGILLRLEVEPSVAEVNFLFERGHHQAWLTPVSIEHHPLSSSQDGRDWVPGPSCAWTRYLAHSQALSFAALGMN